MIRYQGVLSEYPYQCYQFQTQAFHRSGQMLSYQGMYNQESQPSGYSSAVSLLKPPLSNYPEIAWWLTSRGKFKALIRAGFSLKYIVRAPINKIALAKENLKLFAKFGKIQF